ncbi:hypothetical protein VPH35_138232 [Triticum aestivum]
MQSMESTQHWASSTAATVPRRSVRCMAGLCYLLSMRWFSLEEERKRLMAKNATPEATLPPPSPPPMKKTEALKSPTQAPGKPRTPTAVRRWRSCEAPRSPTIAPEYRRASCDSPRPQPPAIIASPAPQLPTASTAAFPRRLPPSPGSGKWPWHATCCRDYCKIKQYCNELHTMAMYYHPAMVAAVEGMRGGRRGQLRRRAGSIGDGGAQSGAARWWRAWGGAGLVGAALQRAILQGMVLDVMMELLTHSERPFGQFGHGHDHGGGAMCRKRLCF